MWRHINAFLTKLGLHQDSPLSPYLFVLLMDVTTRHVQDETLQYVLFLNEIVFIDETRKYVSLKLEAWREMLESKVFKIDRSKTEYLECRFSKMVE